jgi:AcrR family transcriptional regulator
MLVAAETLMREQGLAGAGIHEVVKRSRAPIGSLYYYFPGGKTQFASEALQQHGERARALLVAAFRSKKPLPTRLRTFFRNAAKSFEQQGGRKGCAIGAVTLDLGPRDEKLREVCDAIFAGWAADIEPHLPWRSARKRRSFALAIVTALEGAFVVGRAQRSGDPFRAAGECLAAASKHWR